jgi:hypothetical protein
VSLVEAGAEYAVLLREAQTGTKNSGKGERSKACRLCGHMGHKSDTVDSCLDEIASRQHGVVSLRQLDHVGLDRYAVAKRARRSPA